MKMREAALGSVVAVICLVAGQSGAAAFAPCADGEIRQGEVVRVAESGALFLKDGAVLVLEGVRLPNGRRDHAPDAEQLEARAMLGAMLRGHEVQFASNAPLKDRYGRVRAQVSVGGAWVQEVLLREGMARVALLPAHSECAAEFYAAEAAARAAARGVWALPAYGLRKPEQVTKAMVGTFQIVEGRVVAAAVKGGRGFLNFSNDWVHDFTATISPEDMKVFRKRRVKPELYAGKVVRLRGIVGWYRGPQIELMGPESVVVLP